jgi:hypothetical protein
MRPRWEKIEKDNPWLKTEYFDVDEFPELKEKYQLVDIPSFIWLDGAGQEIIRRQGEVTEAELRELINQYREK